MPWAVSNAFYEQILLHYGLENFRPQLSQRDSRTLTVKRGDVLEAYVAGIAMDVSRSSGEGYQELREWFSRVLRLRLRKVSSNGVPGLPLTIEQNNKAADVNLINVDQNNSVNALLKLRQSIFQDMKEAVGQIEWRTPTPTTTQLFNFWSRVKRSLDSLCTAAQSSESQKALMHYYRVDVL
jgi:hypothetical protein